MIKYFWQTKMNHETEWVEVQRFEILADVCKAARDFKPYVSHSGNSGTHILQHQIIDSNGKKYSKFSC